MKSEDYNIKYLLFSKPKINIILCMKAEFVINCHEQELEEFLFPQQNYCLRIETIRNKTESAASDRETATSATPMLN